VRLFYSSETIRAKFRNIRVADRGAWRFSENDAG